jgi:hypothetical protein
LHLSDGRDVFVRLPLSPDRDAADAVAALRELSARGIRFRTRALTTTLFARLFLADLFVHGIGGAKYDEMTDRIIAEFYHVPVPEFLTLTATALLPLQPFEVTDTNRQWLLQRLRELQFHAERFIEPHEVTTEVQLTILEKQAFLALDTATRKVQRTSALNFSKPPQRIKRGYRLNYDTLVRMQEVNRGLAKHVAGLRDQTVNELANVTLQLTANRILGSREFSYCLFPPDRLRRLTETIQRGE